MTRHLFFDLGETLVRYYSRGQFQATLPTLLKKLYTALEKRLPGPIDHYWSALQAENHENPDFSVRKLELRLANIFNISEETVTEEGLCDLFLSEMLKVSSIYEDTIGTLKALFGRYELALVSNTPWGSPKHYFEDELARYGINRYLKNAIFCREVGYRKPHRKIFEYALERTGAKAAETIMIGDRYEWDVVGARQCGMNAILVDREGTSKDDCMKIKTLSELLEIRLGGTA